MSWNNYYEQEKFNREEAIRLEYFRSQGVSEEDIEKVRKMDLEMFRSDRRFYERTVSYEEKTDCMGEEGKNAFLRHISGGKVESMCIDYSKEFWWLETIEDEEMYTIISGFSRQKKLILDSIVMNGFTKTETARRLGINRRTVYLEMLRMRRALESVHSRWYRQTKKEGGEENV